MGAGGTPRCLAAEDQFERSISVARHLAKSIVRTVQLDPPSHSFQNYAESKKCIWWWCKRTMERPGVFQGGF